MRVKLFADATETKVSRIYVRPLFVNGRVKEFVTGDVHDVTDRLFVARRAFRVNDTLPLIKSASARKHAPPKWIWQLGGWLLVDRSTATIKQINLPEFDPFYSSAVWFRDYVAYCGISDNAEKLYAVVIQLGRRKPIIRKEIGEESGGKAPEINCTEPIWEKQPVRVSFQPKNGIKSSYFIRGHTADIVYGSERENSEERE